ncbi:hypothetical protein TRFO_37411 [Tritrichomonas foetus]|uniref:BTB domain-containing protein n=1 Tax=Tritrichomonas foetus TaxID=1144522 RepID=A0A1J4JB75_9EUKA|nr:hypothetical protein TRFO_37411 [Tritrichomonas foetus]|eukprot:OHS96430.1 hypothetical protein TRFO_37411 [Tritrichomonas foetus]
MNFSIKLKKNALENLAIDSYEKNFAFIINGKEFRTSRFIADILSPKVSKLHEFDPTIDTFSFNVDLDNHSKKSKKPSSENIYDVIDDFPLLFNLVTNSTIDIPAANKRRMDFFTESFCKLGNEQMLRECMECQGKSCDVGITNENVFKRI